jgi:hypothetical protein
VGWRYVSGNLFSLYEPAKGDQYAFFNFSPQGLYALSQQYVRPLTVHFNNHPSQELFNSGLEFISGVCSLLLIFIDSIET